MGNKFVYFDNLNYHYSEIDCEYLNSPENVANWFGCIEDHLNTEGELVIYELIPHKVLKKEINFKFKENE